MTDIHVAICTFRRASLAETILSVDAQRPVRAARIIVIDNDDTPSAAVLVDSLRSRVQTDILYTHAPARNISVARNRALDLVPRGKLAFIDDDEIAAPDWLAHLNAALTPGLAAVFGPVTPQYAPGTPDWMVRLAPHQSVLLPTKGRYMAGYSCNCLIDRTDPVWGGRAFDLARGQTGGEDTAFFAAAALAGATYGTAPDAHMVEPVAPHRATLRWLFARRMAGGISLHQAGLASALMAVPKIAYCAATALLHLFAPVARYRALLRAGLHLGTLRSGLGARRANAYGGPDARDTAFAPAASTPLFSDFPQLKK